MFDPNKWLKQRKVATLTPVDAKVSSLVEELVGEKIKGSWWGHSQAHLIYNTYQHLVRDPAVLTMKLIKGKVTFVHRELWASMLSAVLDQTWQQSTRCQLSPLSEQILKLVEQQGTLLCISSNLPFNESRRELRKARVELERRALIISGDKPTDSGAHAPYLESWNHFYQARMRKINRFINRDKALQSIKKWTGKAWLTIEYPGSSATKKSPKLPDMKAFKI